MNELVDSKETMTSVELVKIINELREEGQAELKHNDFLKKVQKVLGEEGSGKYSHTYTHPQNGQIYPCYNLPKREAQLMVMSESYKVQAAVYDRWQELESKPSFDPANMTRMEILEMAIRSESERLVLESKIAADAPKVEFAMAVRNLDGSCLVEQFAKTIGIGRNTFYKKLRDGGFLMFNNLPYQRYLDSEWFVVVEGVPFVDAYGKSHPSFTARITGKGQVALEKKFRQHQPNNLVLITGDVKNC